MRSNFSSLSLHFVEGNTIYEKGRLQEKNDEEKC